MKQKYTLFEKIISGDKASHAMLYQPPNERSSFGYNSKERKKYDMNIDRMKASVLKH